MDRNIIGPHHATELEIGHVAKHSEGRSWGLLGIAAVAKNISLEVHVGYYILSHLGSGLVLKTLSTRLEGAKKPEKAIDVKRHLRFNLLGLLSV